MRINSKIVIQLTLHSTEECLKIDEIIFSSFWDYIWLLCIIKNICWVTNDSESIIFRYFLLYHMLCSQKKYQANKSITDLLPETKKKYYTQFHMSQENWCYVFVNWVNHSAKIYNNFLVTYSDFTLPRLFKANFTFTW